MDASLVLEDFYSRSDSSYILKALFHYGLLSDGP